MDRAGKPVVLAPYSRRTSLASGIRLIQRNLVQDFLADMHQNRIEPRGRLEPGGDCRVTSKRGQLAEHLQKRILRKILGLRGVVGHAQQTNKFSRLCA